VLAQFNVEPMTGIEPAYSAWEFSTPEQVCENRGWGFTLRQLPTLAPPAHTCPSMSVRLRFNPPGRPSFHWCRKQYTVSG
jgi:hypothetical protein